MTFALSLKTPCRGYSSSVSGDERLHPVNDSNARVLSYLVAVLRARGGPEGGRDGRTDGGALRGSCVRPIRSCPGIAGR